MDVARLVERLWPGQDAAVEPLGGGITNHNFKVTVGGETLVLRVGGKDTELLGIDRTHEHEASLLAAHLGIGPEVVRFEDGCLVTRFVEGKVGDPDPTPVGDLLRRLHSSAPIAARFDAFRVVEAYAETAAAHGVRIPPEYDEACEVAGRIEATRAGAPVVPCHNDLLALNFIDDGVRTTARAPADGQARAGEGDRVRRPVSRLRRGVVRERHDLPRRRRAHRRVRHARITSS